MSNAGEIPIQGSEDSKLISLDYVPSSSLGNETPVEVSKSKPVSSDDVSPLNVVASSVEESKESSKLNFLKFCLLFLFGSVLHMKRKPETVQYFYFKNFISDGPSYSHIL